MSIENSWILQKTLEWNSSIPGCRWCGKKPNSDIIIKYRGLPPRCVDRNCRKPTAFMSDRELENVNRKRLGNLNNRWKGHDKTFRKPVKPKPKLYACLVCERIYDSETKLEQHKLRRTH